MLFEEASAKFYEHMHANDRARKTIYGYVSDLKKFKAFYEGRNNIAWYVEDTTVEDIEAFLRMLQDEKGLQPASRNRILHCLKSFFKYLATRGLCPSNPAEGVASFRYGKRDRVHLKPDEFDELVGSIEKPLIKMATQTLYYTGLRISELVGLSMADVDLNNRVLHVLGKGSIKRDVPISNTLLPVLVRYRNQQRSRAQPWERFFVTESTGRLSPSYYNAQLHKATRNLDWDKNVTAHTMRHTFATNLAKQGVSLVCIQKLLGHSSLTVTSVYTHATISDLAESVNLL